MVRTRLALLIENLGLLFDRSCSRDRKTGSLAADDRDVKNAVDRGHSGSEIGIGADRDLALPEGAGCDHIAGQAVVGGSYGHLGLIARGPDRHAVHFRGIAALVDGVDG